MPRVLNYVPRVTMFLAGAATAALFLPRSRRPAADSDTSNAAVADLAARMQLREAADALRFAQLEAKIAEYEAKLNDVPSTGQLVAAMEEVLNRTMASLDHRLTTQAHSIEVLKTTVTQTDNLLERVLESLDSLQTYSEPATLPEDSLLTRPAI